MVAYAPGDADGATSDAHRLGPHDRGRRASAQPRHAGRIPLADASGGHPVRPGAGLHHVDGKLIGAADEVGHELGLRTGIDVAWLADLLDLTFAEHGDAIGHRERLLLIVRDVDEGDADLTLHRLQQALELLAEPQVERSERLIQQQDLGVEHQRAGQGDALLLATGQLSRTGTVPPGQVDELEHALDAQLDLSVRRLALAQAKGNVLEDVKMGKQRVVLEHGRDRTLEGGPALHLLTVHLDGTGGWVVEPGDQAQRRRLAAAAWPD